MILNLFCEPSPLLVPSNAGLLLSLVSQAGGVSALAWVWNGINPSLWELQASVDGGVTWTAAQEWAGTYRTDTYANVTALVRLYGYDQPTGYSNVVDLSGGVPANALVDSAGNVLVDSAGNILTT